jgi:phospholipid N-methyltransferase
MPRVTFLTQFLRHPLATGAIAPSSRHLARAMVAGMDLARARVIIEYGPGTGVFTREILRRRAPDAVFFAVERNAVLAAELRQRFPGIRVFEESAASIRDLAGRAGVEAADCILCGLPWASFGNDLQETILAATRSVLRHGGRFATFAYLQGLLLPSGQRFRQKLARTFSRVRRSPIVWRNLPPAFVYRCVR